MCEVILYRDDNFETYNDGWIADDKRNALAYLRILESFEFIYALVNLQWCLMLLKEAVVKLQGEDQDLVNGVLLVEHASDALQALRTDIDAYCSRILQQFKYCCKIKYSCFNATNSTKTTVSLQSRM